MFPEPIAPPNFNDPDDARMYGWHKTKPYYQVVKSFLEMDCWQTYTDAKPTGNKISDTLIREVFKETGWTGDRKHHFAVLEQYPADPANQTNFYHETAILRTMTDALNKDQWFDKMANIGPYFYTGTTYVNGRYLTKILIDDYLMQLTKNYVENKLEQFAEKEAAAAAAAAATPTEQPAQPEQSRPKHLPKDWRPPASPGDEAGVAR